MLFNEIYFVHFLRIVVCLTCLHLHALVHEGEDVATSNQLLNGASQTLS